MPLRYESLGPDAIKQWPGDSLITSANLKDNKIELWNIYFIKYKYSDDFMFPNICERTKKTLVQVLQSENFDLEEAEADWKPVYGDSIITAIENDPGCQIKINKYIRFIPDYVFRDFVSYFFQKRRHA